MGLMDNMFFSLACSNMSKRRRTSSIASSKGQEDDSLDSLEASTSTGPTMRKRSKKQDPVSFHVLVLLLIQNSSINT